MKAVRAAAVERSIKMDDRAMHGGIPSYPSVIEPWLFLGSLWHAKQTDPLIDLAITHVVNVGSQVPCYHAEKASMLDGRVSEHFNDALGRSPTLPPKPVAPEGIPSGDALHGSAAAGTDPDPRWLGLKYFHAMVEDDAN